MGVTLREVGVSPSPPTPHPVSWLPTWSVVEILCGVWGLKGRWEGGGRTQLARVKPTAGWKWLLGCAASSVGYRENSGEVEPRVGLSSRTGVLGVGWLPRAGPPVRRKLRLSGGNRKFSGSKLGDRFGALTPSNSSFSSEL